MNELQIEDKIVAAFERLSEVFRVLSWKMARKFGLSPLQIKLLIFLNNHDPSKCNVSYLSKEFSLSKATVSDAVFALETKGFVKKITNASDARSHFLTVTENGKTLTAELSKFTTPFRQIIEELQEKEKVMLWNLLQKIIFESNRSGLISIQRMCMNCRFYEKRKSGHYCNLLKKRLLISEIRVDCPDFVEAEQSQMPMLHVQTS